MKVMRGGNIPDEELANTIKIFTDYVTRDPSELFYFILYSITDSRTGSFSDNRDFKTLPNLQSKVDDNIWTQTQMGPRAGVNNLNFFS